MKKALKIFSYILATIILLSVVAICFIYVKENNYLAYSTGSKDKAFLNSTWLMSPNEIKRANNTYLSKPDFEFFGFEPDVVNQDRYSAFTQKNLNLWSYASDIEYSFFDKKLYKYYIKIEPYNIDKIKDEILITLKNRYGEPIKNKKKITNLLFSHEWETGKQKISYWGGKNDQKGYYIGIRATYTPYYESIKEIAKSEKDTYF